MNKEDNSRYSLLNENDLLDRLQSDDGAFIYIYSKHKNYCINFMKSKYDNLHDIEDIYQDATIVLREKVFSNIFVLTCTIQTYLNSICYNQVLKRLKGNEKTIHVDEQMDENYNRTITDWLVPIEDDTNSERLKLIYKGLAEMEKTGGICYQLLLSFFYKNKTMDKIAQEFNYTNADSAKQQKARCQKRLKESISKMQQQ